MNEQSTIDENKRRAVNVLREVADKIERGDVALLSVGAGSLPEYDTFEHIPLNSRKRQTPSSYVRILEVSYSERASPFITCKLEDFTQG